MKNSTFSSLFQPLPAETIAQRICKAIANACGDHFESTRICERIARRLSVSVNKPLSVYTFADGSKILFTGTWFYAN